MTGRFDVERALDQFLAPDHDRVADRVIEAALDQISDIPQARRGLLAPWRTFLMSSTARLAAGALAVALMAVGGLFLLATNSTGPGGPSLAPSVAPSPTLVPSPSLTSLDTRTWVTYTSARYGFTIGHPADWTAFPSAHVWVLATDAIWSSAATESFVAPLQAVRVSAWSVAVAPGTTVETWIANSYCPLNQVPTPSDQSPCDRIGHRSWPVTMDGHAGSLVQFADDTQAFVLVNGRMYIVAVWEPDNDPRTAPFGGAQQLLKDYLSTVHLLPGGPAPETNGALAS